MIGASYFNLLGGGNGVIWLRCVIPRICLYIYHVRKMMDHYSYNITSSHLLPPYAKKKKVLNSFFGYKNYTG